eukprot:6338805-Amphidinium_carterae.1
MSLALVQLTRGQWAGYAHCLRKDDVLAIDPMAMGITQVGLTLQTKTKGPGRRHRIVEAYIARG